MTPISALPVPDPSPCLIPPRAFSLNPLCIPLALVLGHLFPLSLFLIPSLSLLSLFPCVFASLSLPSSLLLRRLSCITSFSYFSSFLSFITISFPSRPSSCPDHSLLFLFFLIPLSHIIPSPYLFFTLLSFSSSKSNTAP